MYTKQDAEKADWSSVEKRPTWAAVTTKELSIILKVPPQNLNNWLLRGAMPLPIPRKRGHGNKNRFKISTIRSWLEKKPEDEIHWDFINRQMGEGFRSIEQAIYNAQRDWKAFGIEKPSF